MPSIEPVFRRIVAGDVAGARRAFAALNKHLGGTAAAAMASEQHRLACEVAGLPFETSSLEETSAHLTEVGRKLVIALRALVRHTTPAMRRGFIDTVVTMGIAARVGKLQDAEQMRVLLEMGAMWIGVEAAIVRAKRTPALVTNPTDLVRSTGDFSFTVPADGVASTLPL